MKIGISTLLFNIEEALELCNKIDKINHLEIGIDNLSECEALYKYKDKINRLGLTVGIHLPMELNTCENIEYINHSWVNFIKDMHESLKEFKIKYFNLHLGYIMTNRLKNNRQKYLNNSIKFIDSITIDTDICIENVYCKKGNFSNIGNISYDFEYIFSMVKNSKLYFCYDTGHNLIDSDDYIDKLKQKIKVIHLSDNDGIEDTHIGIGMGLLSKEQIKEVLDLNPEYLILEISYGYIKDTINTINEIIGEV